MTDLATEAPPVDSLEPDENAPFGYRMYGGKRVVKKTPNAAGRPRKDAQPAPAMTGSPSIEDLKLAGFGSAAPVEDREPGLDPRAKPARREPVDVPPFRAGPIAKGVNRLYRKAGKLVRVADPELGAAIIQCTRKSTYTDDDGIERVDEDDVTVGEAWEELARTNVRVRMFLLRMLSGGALVNLVMAHAPILLAIMLKDAVMRRIPFHRFIESWLADDDGDEAPQQGAPTMGGMTQADMGQMVAAAQAMAANMAAGMGPNGAPRGGMPFRMPTVEDLTMPPDEM